MCLWNGGVFFNSSSEEAWRLDFGFFFFFNPHPSSEWRRGKTATTQSSSSPESSQVNRGERRDVAYCPVTFFIVFRVRGARSSTERRSSRVESGPEDEFDQTRGAERENRERESGVDSVSGGAWTEVASFRLILCFFSSLALFEQERKKLLEKNAFGQEKEETAGEVWIIKGLHFCH